MPNTYVLNQSTIDEIKNITGKEDLTLLKKMIRSYLDECPTQMDAIVNAISTNDFDALILTSHALKSSSISIGADRLAAACLTIELMAKDHSLPRGNFSLVREAFDEVKPHLEALL